MTRPPHKRTLNILKELVKTTQQTYQSLQYQLPTGGADEDIDKRFLSDLADAAICLQLYENRLEKEVDVDGAEGLTSHTIHTSDTAPLNAAKKPTENRKNSMHGEDTKK